LKSHGEDVKTVQELLRHGNSGVTMNLYAQAVTDIKRSAQSKVARLVFKSEKVFGPAAKLRNSTNSFVFLASQNFVSLNSFAGHMPNVAGLRAEIALINKDLPAVSLELAQATKPPRRKRTG
jgi:hypothetical protein